MHGENVKLNWIIVCRYDKSVWQYTNIKTLGSFGRIKY